MLVAEAEALTLIAALEKAVKAVLVVAEPLQIQIMGMEPMALQIPAVVAAQLVFRPLMERVERVVQAS
jgi:hypothetical protein